MRRWLAFNIALALLVAGIFLATLYGPPILPDVGHCQPLTVGTGPALSIPALSEESQHAP